MILFSIHETCVKCTLTIQGNFQNVFPFHIFPSRLFQQVWVSSLFQGHIFHFRIRHNLTERPECRMLVETCI